MSITKKIFVSAFIAAFAFGVSAANAAYMHTVTLKQGSTGSQVMSLQQTLNMTSCKVALSGAGAPGMETMTFGPKTKVAVQCFQAWAGVAADGVVGPVTGAKLAAVTGSGSGSGLPAGCTSTAGYSPTTGQPCSGGSSTPTGPLSGGAGDLDITTTSTDVENTVQEGDTENILGMNAEADGSDIAITSIKVEFKNTNYGSSSENFERYVDSVSIMLGDEEVGSADADDFSRDSGTPDLYSRTISLSNAIVREDDEEKLYVAVTASDDIDTENFDATWDVEVQTIRFTDATGAILSGDVTGVEYADNDAFDFEDSSVDNDIELKSSSDNPEDMTVKVDEDDTTDDVLALVARLDNDEDSSDMTILDIPVSITIDNYGSDADTAEDVIDEVIVEINGDEFEADLSGAGTLNVDGTTAVAVTYNLDLDDGDVVIEAGDVVDVKVYISFKGQEDNYDDNAIVTATINKADIEAEDEEGDEVTVDGANRTGADLTLNTAAAIVSDFDWTVNSAGTIVDFFFTIEAEDEDFDVLAAEILEGTPAGTATVTDTSGTPETTQKGVLSRYSGDAVDAIGSTGFTVDEGEEVTFRVRYNLSGSNGTWKEFTITSVAGQEVPDEEETSPTATLNVN